MKELIKITENEGKRAVSARELHSFLEVGDVFPTWCKRMFKYGFVQDVDYSKSEMALLDSQRVTNPNPKIDYVLTVECAKEISMIQRTEKGKEARLYFIECEKRLSQPQQYLPQDYLSALKALVESEEQKQIAESKVKELTPKGKMYDDLMDSDVAISFGQFSKMIGVGRNSLFKICREDKILISKGRERNNPYQKYIDSGYFEVIEKPVKISEDKTIISQQTLITPKGQEWLGKKLS